MKKLNFDGRLLEGKNVERKLRDIAYEMDFSGNEQEEHFYYNNVPKKFYHNKRKFFYS